MLFPIDNRWHDIVLRICWQSDQTRATVATYVDGQAVTSGSETTMTDSSRSAIPN